MEYAERLLDYFKNARVLAPTDSKLASIEQKLDSILPYVTSKLYELEEVAEPEDPELAGLFSWGGVYYIVIFILQIAGTHEPAECDLRGTDSVGSAHSLDGGVVEDVDAVEFLVRARDDSADRRVDVEG